MISANRHDKYFAAKSSAPPRYVDLRNDSAFYLSRQHKTTLPSCVAAYSRQSATFLVQRPSQKCSLRRLLRFPPPCHFDIYAKLRTPPRDEAKSGPRPEILGSRTTWQPGGFFNLRIRRTPTAARADRN